ncbi:MAG: bifunctional proline dehydrogenase/L-glutamate gamma-semialdehyde dehydrogenase PutA [Betaproteobacteria bacterium]
MILTPAELERARSLARRLAGSRGWLSLDIQRVFSFVPPDSPQGERLFRLVEAFPRTADKANRKALAHEYAPLPQFMLQLGAHLVGRQFVYAETIGDAVSRGRRSRRNRFSFDILGEGARTAEDAERYFARYREAVAAAAADGERFGVSIKLSSLHPRFDAAGYARSRGVLLEKLVELCTLAADARVQLTIDAEESERLGLQLDLFAALAQMPSLASWRGLGLAVQAYRRDVLEVVDRVIGLDRPVCVRLVKGAYWDAEVKRAQELGLDDYPVFTDKAESDRAYLAAAKKLLESAGAVYPQFATHNPVTLACVLAMAESRGAQAFECQRLHGMGQALDAALARVRPDVPMRIYAPVGERRELLAYLVRRLLENSASTSYVRRAAALDAGKVLAEGFAALEARPHEIAPPRELHMPERKAARGNDVGELDTLAALARGVEARRQPWRASPVVGGRAVEGRRRDVFSPARPDVRVGEVFDVTPDAVRVALAAAHAASGAWPDTPVEERAGARERLAELIEADRDELMARCVWEAGKTLPDALADVREAVDFCRYYAARARESLYSQNLVSPAGETNTLSFHGRGVFACISPWNFPVAIFTGQVAAALVTGNAVVAKPAEQACLTAARVAELIQQAGVPADVFHLLPGDGEIGRAIVEDARIAGVVFTGSTDVARSIQLALASKQGPLVPLIAETGGLNAMIVDSTALPEQVVDSVIQSAFRSAGQRCSSLRMLYLQNEIAPQVIALLRGAMAELVVGDPSQPGTDVGPVIDADAKSCLGSYVGEMRARRKVVGESRAEAQGHFVPPIAFEVGSIRDLPGERFGPILHVARFAIGELERVLDDINSMGYGLTMGLHTRLDSRIEFVRARARVGNLYVNRNMIGAVVGVQPFGGEGLSGTGPKAGGPHYLTRFVTERVCTVNTAAAGGDLRLLTRSG